MGQKKYFIKKASAFAEAFCKINRVSRG
jgi:hypothetical protein